MKDQHTKIKGYRDLSQVEIDLMNEIKAKASEVEALINKLAARSSVKNTESSHWLERARDDLQDGFMKLVRSVAQPTTF